MSAPRRGLLAARPRCASVPRLRRAPGRGIRPGAPPPTAGEGGPGRAMRRAPPPLPPAAEPGGPLAAPVPTLGAASVAGTAAAAAGTEGPGRGAGRRRAPPRSESEPRPPPPTYRQHLPSWRGRERPPRVCGCCGAVPASHAALPAMDRGGGARPAAAALSLSATAAGAGGEGAGAEETVPTAHGRLGTSRPPPWSGIRLGTEVA